MGSGNGEAGLVAGDFPEHLRTLDDFVAVLLNVDEFAHISRDSRSADDKGVLDVFRDEVHVVLVVHIDSLGLQLSCKL